MNELDIEYLKMKLESQSQYVGGERERCKKRGEAEMYSRLDMLYLKLLSCLNEADSILELARNGKGA